ncbi:MAG: 50S ribosomal protein L31 [Patescibacteria group bacterium]
MKKDIHPQYYPNAKVTCACGNSFTTGSTQEEIKTELCSMCHPFFTGQQKIVDTARRVEKFKEKMAKTSAVSAQRKGKTAKRKAKAAKKTKK